MDLQVSSAQVLHQSHWQKSDPGPMASHGSMFKFFQRTTQSTPLGFRSQKGHHVTDPDQIVSILAKAARSNALMTATFKSHDKKYNTALLEVDSETGTIVIDEFTPNSGNRVLKELKELTLTGRPNGVELRFETELVEAGEQNGIALYHTTLPQKVFYLQRRLDHRISTQGLRIPFQGYRGKGMQQQVFGHLHDMSYNGLGILLDEPLHIKPGEVLTNCIITLPDEGNAEFTLEVRFYSRNPERRYSRLGARFYKLDRDSERKIRRILNQMEREQLRKIRGD